MKLLPLLFLFGVSSGLKYIEEREVKTSSGKVFTCFYTIQYNAKGVVSKKSTVACTPTGNGGTAMPVFDLPGVGPTAIKHSVKKGKGSIQDYSPHSAPVSQDQAMNCSCSLSDSPDMKPKPKPENPPEKPGEKPEMMQMMEDMCADGGKPEKLKEFMEKMGITKEMIIQMIANGGDKEEMMQNIMSMMGGHGESPKPDKMDMLQQLLGGNMGKPMGGMGNPMGGMGKPMGGMGKPMGGMGKPHPHPHPHPPNPMGGMGKPGGEDCMKKLLMMICSKKPMMKPPSKPECMSCSQMERNVMEMLEGKMKNINCECVPMKKD